MASVNLSLFAGAGWQFFTNNGTPLAGGFIYTYAAGTTTPSPVYTSSTGGTAHANPIVLNSSGRVATGEIWQVEGQSYKFVLKDSTGTTIGTYDDINSTYVSQDLANTSNPTLGDALVGFRQSNSSGNLTGSVGRTVHQKFQESVSVLDFGATGDGTTDDTAAIQAALNAHECVYFPAGNYKVTTITFNINQIIYGDGATTTGTTITGTSGYPAIKAWGCAPPAFTNSCKFTISNLRIIGPDLTSNGIDIYSAIDCTFNNLWIEGWNYGIKARTTIDMVFNGNIRLTANNVGLKIPAYSNVGDGAIQNICANCWSFDLLNVRSNVKAGMSLGTAGNWVIQNALAENNKTAIYALEYINFFSLGCLYIESAQTSTTVNRLGNNQNWAFYMGEDEDGNTGTNSSTNIVLTNIMTYSDTAAFNFQNVTGVELFVDSGRGIVQCGVGTRNIKSNCVGGETPGNQIVVGEGRGTVTGVYRSGGYNYISNGNMAYANLPTIVASVGGPTITRTTQTLNGQNTNVMSVSLPIGAATVSVQFQVNLGTDALLSEAILFYLHGIASSANVTEVNLAYYDNSGLRRSTATLTSGLTSWHVLQKGFSVPSNEQRFYIQVEIKRTVTTSLEYYYIDEIVACNQYSPVLSYPSVFDYTQGNTFTGTCTVSSGGLYYVEFTTTYPYYYVLATPVTAGSTIAKTAVYYSGGTFRVYSDINNTVVYGMIIPTTVTTP